MKTLEQGKDKIKKICDVLRDETLEPAQKEAREIIEKAQQQADSIISEAEKNAEKLHLNAKAAIEQENAVFQSALQQAGKQFLETLRQGVEKEFFNHNLSAIIEKGVSDPKVIAGMVNALVKALEKDGLAADLTALVAKTVSPRQINELLLQEVLKKLKDQSVSLGNFGAGVQLKVNSKKMTIDLSEDALRELLASYIVRKDFRKMIFDLHN